MNERKTITEQIYAENWEKIMKMKINLVLNHFKWKIW